MSEATGHNLNSPYADARKRGLRWLRFVGFVEDEFRQAYVEATRARAGVILGGSIATILVLFGIRLTDSNTSVALLLFELCVLLASCEMALVELSE